MAMDATSSPSDADTPAPSRPAAATVVGTDVIGRLAEEAMAMSDVLLSENGGSSSKSTPPDCSIPIPIPTPTPTAIPAAEPEPKTVAVGRLTASRPSPGTRMQNCEDRPTTNTHTHTQQGAHSASFAASRHCSRRPRHRLFASRARCQSPVADDAIGPRCPSRSRSRCPARSRSLARSLARRPGEDGRHRPHLGLVRAACVGVRCGAQARARPHGPIDQDAAGRAGRPERAAQARGAHAVSGRPVEPWRPGGVDLGLWGPETSVAISDRLSVLRHSSICGASLVP